MTTSTLTNAREAFAAVLEDVWGSDSVSVLPWLPATPRASSAFVRTPISDPWLNFTGENATFRQPELRLEAVLIGPNGDWKRSISWLEEHISILQTGLLDAQQPPSPSTMTNKAVMTEVSPPGLLDAAKQLLAVEIKFAPFNIKGLLT